MTFGSLARLRDMRPQPIASAGRVVLWITLITGFLLLSIAAALRAEALGLSGSATRRQEFTASGALRSLAVENLNGNVRIVAGPAFAATVELTARAATDREARRILDDTECRFSNEDGDLFLVVGPAGARIRRSKHGGWEIPAPGGGPGRVEAGVEVTLPPGVRVRVSAVNGSLSATGITADLSLSTVNGKIEVSGARQGLKINTINGNIEAAVTDVPKDSALELKSVSGNLSLSLPAAAAFRFEGKTLSGEIVSTFPLPARAEEAELARSDRAKATGERAKVAAERTRVRRAPAERALSEDLSELNRALGEMSRELSRMSGEIAREVVLTVNRSYDGTAGGGGALVRMSNLSGRIALLSEGTTVAQARPLLPARRARVVETVPVPPERPGLPEPLEMGRPVRRGDVAGDFVATDICGDVTLGRVSGKVKVATQWGEIRVVSAGKGADLSSAGGGVRADVVTGDLVAATLGGDIRIGNVSGDARLETTGGDIVLKSSGGAVKAVTSGGEITLRKVRGPLVAQTSGGGIFCEIVSAEKAGVEVATGGGDVTLVLPANYRGDVDVRVTGVDAEGDYILSQFPDIAVVKLEGLQKGEGKLGGGGPKILVRTTAGLVRIRKGPAAP